MPLKRLVLLAGWLALLLAGCPAPQQQVTVRVIDEAELAAVRQRHLGKVVLVDYWATWCRPCVELFPHTVELHNRFAPRGLAVISVSLDDPGELSAVRAFLDRRAATFDNFISKYGTGPQSLEAFEIDDGAVPHFKFYDRNGKLHKALSSGGRPIDPLQIDRAVEELLGP